VHILRKKSAKIAMNKREPLIDLLIHDLTGPLSIVLASVKNLLDKKEKYGTSDRQVETLERILRNSTKAKALLQELVEVYRSEEGRFCTDNVPVEGVLKEAVLDALEVIDPQKAQSLLCLTGNKIFDSLREEGIVVEISGKYRTTPFLHDYRKVRQITRNLISNALKHRKNQVVVSASGEEDLVVTVQDDGFGISQREQDEIFNRFADLTDKTNSGEKGLGFGLSCVKTLVEAIGGDITVISGEGRGTCFTVHIPPLFETKL
jgi:signal transduction histidine kinase